ncbi:aspartate aminotransferase family protein [Alloalcanivorax gelatiniphagus]|uniref:Acetylornithine aminotransferase n=1 Tax=Alloalcanivorax gelatiniphagus TaxID=1194167 RepID=A0ABY2XQ70_9GAMM|nr:aspartate aminotransferase family protein [Alloalcanivorax gelatiniphagus]TMW14812.1 aspartate aminotransferase family protein [Alloalcanivorax gelatiniphagus]
MSEQFLIPTYARQPVAFERGEGVWLYDQTGKRYLDAVAGVAVCNLGHAHPAVTRALSEQAARLVHTSNLYRIPAQEALAERLCRLAGMDKVFFGNSGAEANEAAIKLARLHARKRGVRHPVVLVMENSFHGRTLATLSATGNRKVKEGFEPLVEGFRALPYDDLAAVDAAAEDPNVVAVLAEPVQGEGGVRVPDPGFLSGLRERCDRHGWLLMLDEIQTGNGRTGAYFACLEQGVVPDVLTTAKGLGNGFPIGACLVTGAASELFGPGSHGSTFGGSPLGCATALAVVETLERDVVPTVNAKGERLRAALRQRLADLPMVREVRGLGLIIGIQLDRDAGELVGRAREAGLLINVTAGSVVRLLPPLVIEDQELDFLADTLSRVLVEFARDSERP